MKFSISVPETLNDITLEQYQNFIQIEEPTAEDLLKCFLNLDLTGIGKMKDSDVDAIAVHLNSLFEQEPKHALKFILKGKEHGFIPDLDNITYGENKDITTYINDWSTMHKAMTVLYRPVHLKKRDKYLIDDYNGTRERSEGMKQMPLGIAMGAVVFFYNLTNELLGCIPNYLQQQVNKEQATGTISEESGEVIKNSILSLRVMLGDLTKLPNLNYTPV